MLPPSPNIALVHDWLVSMRGGERALEVLCELFPGATLFTLVHKPGSVSPSIERMTIRTSFIQHLPLGTSRYQHYLPLFPSAIRQLDLRGFDLIISSSHAAAKAVRVGPGALHLCYCYTPMRYIWDQYHEYFGERSSPAIRLAMRLMLPWLRSWDVRSAQSVHHFAAISRNVQERIKRIYGRDSELIYPPVETSRFRVALNDDGYYLIVSALVPYKRIDIAIEAFNRSGRRLLIIGTGGEEARLRALAGKNIKFLGWVDDADLPQYYEGCKGVIFPGEEDFGIVPVEAMACGKPVVALAKGGALETVRDGITGVLFSESGPEGIERGVQRLESMRFDPAVLRAAAGEFDRLIFAFKINEFITRKWDMFKRDAN